MSSVERYLDWLLSSLALHIGDAYCFCKGNIVKITQKEMPSSIDFNKTIASKNTISGEQFSTILLCLILLQAP